MLKQKKAGQSIATLLPETTLSISRRISLMPDQVDALRARGVAASFRGATLDAREMRRRPAGMQGRLLRISPSPASSPSSSFGFARGSAD